MEVKNAVMPNEEQLKGFNDQEEDKPIFMVNLLKFKEKAQYPDKREMGGLSWSTNQLFSSEDLKLGVV